MAPPKKIPRIIQTTLLADLRPALEGWADPVAFGVGYGGAVYAAARRPSTEALTTEKGVGIFPKSRLDGPSDYIVVRADGRDVQTVTVPDVSVVVSFVQPCPGGALLAGSRCHWRPEGPEQNAFVVDWKGNVERAFTIGDGVQDVRVAASGDAWASYFDEGVFGNYGWNSPGPDPIGASGLVRFDASGTVLFTYDSTAAGTDSICDAYAVNLADDGTVWVYFYTEFPLVSIRAGVYRSWKLGIAGAGALAVRDGQVLLFGDYEKRCLGRIVALEGDEATVVDEVLIHDSRGEPLDKALAYGSGERLVFFKERQALVLPGW